MPKTYKGLIFSATYLEPELFENMEKARGDVPRAKWIKRAIEAKIKGGKS